MNKMITLAGGCFWGTEKFLSLIEGVVSTETGYANGKKPGSVSYKEVCTGNTGHSEAVRVEYDPARISLGYLLTVFYQSIDPTAVNRQGNDVGTQYRTGVYYHEAGDKAIVEASLKMLQKNYQKPLAVECLPLKNYVSAEAYHQKYLDKNPAGYCHIHDFSAAKKAKDPSFA